MSALYVWILAAMLFLAPTRNHEALAHATANVLADEPALFIEDESKLRTAALVVAIEFRESSFRDVTSATRDHCFMQLHDRPDLLGHPEACIRAGLRALRASFTSCPGAPLAGYVGGGCSNKRARRISDDRISLAAKLIAEVSP